MNIMFEEGKKIRGKIKEMEKEKSKGGNVVKEGRTYKAFNSL